MHREDRKQQFALILLVSLFVFVIIAVAVGLAIAILYILLRFGVIRSTMGQPKFTDIVLFMSLISMVIGFLITLLTGKISLRPFTRLTNQLNRLATGDFKARIAFGKPISQHPTFRGIETSFNRAAEELEHTELLRSDFANNFSHEFKTPIVSIAGFAKLLRRGDLTDEERDEYLAIIEEESLRLANMATNVLDLTKIENQTILTDVTRFNLSEQIRSAVLLFTDKWTHKDLEMDIDFGEHMIYANEELLKQVWINLIDNAIKFSEPGGTVTVAITEDEDETTITVSNQGTPIPQESMDRIFHKFYQADESHSSEGNGIGLAVVKKVCTLHNGHVAVDSTEGLTTFTVMLPRKPYMAY